MTDTPHEIRSIEWVDFRMVAWLAAMGVCLLVGWTSFDALNDFIGQTFGWHIFEKLTPLTWSVSVMVTAGSFVAIRFLAKFLKIEE